MDHGVGAGATLASLRVKLGGMKRNALAKRATVASVDQQKIDDATDADDIKAALMALILDKKAPAPPVLPALYRKILLKVLT